jgi:DNA-binding MarR family transcriptional regulator
MVELALAPCPRRRNTILEGLELFRAVRAPRSFSSLILFLYTCENEGLTFTELADLAGIPLASASRLIRSLTGRGDGVERGVDTPLFRIETSTHDRRLKQIRLTEEGLRMRQAFETLIAAARPIDEA